MAIMSPEVQELFTQVKDVVFSTATADGQPNGSIVGMKAIIDDETIYISDQFFNKTLANMLENQKVSIVFWEDRAAYQIHGTARYVNEGEEFLTQKAWVDAKFKEMGMPITAKGGVFVHVDAVYTSAPGPQAGDQIA